MLLYSLIPSIVDLIFIIMETGFLNDSLFSMNLTVTHCGILVRLHTEAEKAHLL